MALTKDQILQAADQLAAAGTAPTLAAVRSAVGGGSYTTINEALKEWKAKQQATNAPIREPAPAAVATRLEELGADIWAVALELAKARLTSEREALEATRQQLETAQQEATELADQLSAELETLQNDLHEARAELDSANITIDQVHTRNLNLTRNMAVIEARAEETTKRADDLKAELQHAHAANTEQRQRHTSEVQTLQASLTSTSDTLKTQTAEAVRLQAQLDQAQAQLANLQQQQQAQQERHADEIRLMGERLTQAQTEREQALQAAGTTREEAAGMRGELEALRVQNAALLATLAPATDTPKGKASKPPKA